MSILTQTSSFGECHDHGHLIPVLSRRSPISCVTAFIILSLSYFLFGYNNCHSQRLFRAKMPVEFFIDPMENKIVHF